MVDQNSFQLNVFLWDLPVSTISWWVQVTDGNSVVSSEQRQFTLDPVLYHNGPLWYISTGNDSTGNGSEIYPFETIQCGIDRSTGNDTS